jgi:hypothetical protein
MNLLMIFNTFYKSHKNISTFMPIVYAKYPLTLKLLKMQRFPVVLRFVAFIIPMAAAA